MNEHLFLNFEFKVVYTEKEDGISINGIHLVDDNGETISIVDDEFNYEIWQIVQREFLKEFE